jgi:hypothetical protein
MENHIIDKSLYKGIFTNLLSKANSVINTVKVLKSEHNVPFSLSWYNKHASDSKSLEFWYEGQFKRIKSDNGLTEITSQGKEQIEHTRAWIAECYSDVDKLLSRIRPILNNGEIKWTETDKGLTFDEKQLCKYAEDNSTITIDGKTAGEYYSLLASMKEQQRKLLDFERSHGIAQIADNKSSIFYNRAEFGNEIKGKFTLKSLLDVELNEELFKEVFAEEFKKEL